MISVIIPAYNNDRYLSEAVTSVLRQSYQNFEIFIIDDKSTDNTLSCARAFAEQDYRVRVIANHKNLGVAQSRNIGIEAADGDYIAFLDSDDIWMPDKLERQIAEMEINCLDLCYTAYGFMDAEGNISKKIYHVPQTTSLSEMLKENVIGCSTAVFRKHLSKQAKMREEYAHEDYVFWLELMQNGVCAGGINSPLAHYRKTNRGRSYNKLNTAKGRMHVYRDFLDLSLTKSALSFAAYAVNGAKKHFFM